MHAFTKVFIKQPQVWTQDNLSFLLQHEYSGLIRRNLSEKGYKNGKTVANLKATQHQKSNQENVTENDNSPRRRLEEMPLPVKRGWQGRARI